MFLLCIYRVSICVSIYLCVSVWAYLCEFMCPRRPELWDPLPWSWNCRWLLATQCGCWDSNSNPLWMRYLLFPAEPLLRLPYFSTWLQFVLPHLHCHLSLEAVFSVSLPPILLTACSMSLSMLVSWGSVRSHRKPCYSLRTGLPSSWSRSPDWHSHDTKSGKQHLLKFSSSLRRRESSCPFKRTPTYM